MDKPLPACTLFDHIHGNNQDHPQDTALIYFGSKISYGTLFAQVDQCAQALLASGVRQGDFISLCMSSVPEALYLALAASKIGAVANFLNPLFEPQQMIDRINETGSSHLFVLDAMLRFVEKTIGQTCVQKLVLVPVAGAMPPLMRLLASLKSKGKAKGAVTWKAFLNQGKGTTLQATPFEPGRPVLMVYSSGSSGASKGILLTNEGICATIAHYRWTGFAYKRGETMLQNIPIWFSTGIVFSILMPLFLGISVILSPVYSKEVYVKNLKQHKPQLTLATTSMWVHAIQSKELQDCDFSSMSYPITGGEQLLPNVEKEINRFLRERKCTSSLLKGWGMCELGSAVAADSKSHSKPSSVGYPILNVTVSTFDPDSQQELTFGQRGELWVISPARMKGYYKNPEATQAFFVQDDQGNTWGRTGDIGYVDEAGYVFVLGRATDSYTAADGSTHYCFDAEGVILQNPGIAQCKVVPMDVKGQARPVAHLILAEGSIQSPDALLQQVEEACKAQLSPYAVPLAYKVRTSFPVHSSGKQDNQALMQEKDGLLRLDEQGQLVSYAVDVANKSL